MLHKLSRYPSHFILTSASRHRRSSTWSVPSLCQALHPPFILRSSSFSKHDSRLIFVVSRPSHSIDNSHPTMATAFKIHLSTKDVGVFHVKGITEESAVKASEVLQENHENHHVFFNQQGFHSEPEMFLVIYPRGQTSFISG